MKYLMVVLCLFTVAATAPTDDVEVIARRRLPALDHEEIHDQYGQFALRYVTAEGTVVSERGRLVPNLENTGYVMTVEGEVSYIGDDGQTYVTKYTAGLDGYQAEVAKIPVEAEAIVVEEPIVSVPVK